MSCAGGLGAAVFLGGEGVAEPFHHRAAVIVDEAYEPIRHGVVLGVQTQADHRIRGRAGREHGRDADIRPHAVDRAARLDHAAADRIGVLVVRARHDDRIRREAELGGDMRRDGADRRAGGYGRRELVAVQPGPAQQIRRPVVPVHVKQQRAVRQRIIHGRVRPQHEADKSAPVQEPRRTLDQIRLVLVDPHQLGQRVVIAERIAVDRVQAAVIQRAAQIRQVFLAAHVEVEQARAEDLPVGCHRDDRFAHRRHGQRAHRIGRIARHLADRGLHLLPDGGGVQLRPAGLRALRIVFAIGRAQHPAVRRKQRDLAGRSCPCRCRAGSCRGRSWLRPGQDGADAGVAEIIADQAGRLLINRVLRRLDLPGGA